MAGGDHLGHIPSPSIMSSATLPTPTPLHDSTFHPNDHSHHNHNVNTNSVNSSSSLTYMDSVDIGVICFYAPVLFIAVWFAIRHGFGRNSGWIYLTLFVLVRMVGAALELATIGQPTNLGLYKGALILANIGLSPLLLSLLGLLSRVISDIQDDHKVWFRTFHVRILQTVVTIGMILGIVGGVKAGKGLGEKGEQTFSAGPLLEAAIIMFAVVFMALGLVEIVIAKPVFKFANRGERFLFISVIMSMGPIVVRLIYSTVGYFSHDPKWQPPLITGSDAATTYYLCMALLMEYLAVLHWVVAGFFLRVIPKEEWKERKTLFKGLKKKSSNDSDDEDLEKQPPKTTDPMQQGAPPAYANANQGGQGQGQEAPQSKTQQAAEMAKEAGKYTLAGRLLMWTSSAAKERKAAKQEQQEREAQGSVDVSEGTQSVVSGIQREDYRDEAPTRPPISSESSSGSEDDAAHGEEKDDKVRELVGTDETPSYEAAARVQPQRSHQSTIAKPGAPEPIRRPSDAMRRPNDTGRRPSDIKAVSFFGEDGERVEPGVSSPAPKPPRPISSDDELETDEADPAAAAEEEEEQPHDLHQCDSCDRRATCSHRNTCYECGQCARCQCNCD